MPEQDDFMQIALSVVEATKNQAEPAAPVAPAEPPKANEPEARAEGAGTSAGTEKVTPPEEKKVEPPKEEPKKPDWKAAASAEREKQAKRNQSKSAEAELKQKMAQMEQELAEWRDIQRLRTENPLAAAEKAQLSYDALTKQYIESLEKNPAQTTPEVKTLIQNFQSMRDELEHLKSELREERRQKIVGGFEQEVKELIRTKGDEFELLNKAEEGPALVKAIVAAHWNETAERDSQGIVIRAGETMPTEEACRRAEEYFFDKQLKRFQGTKKFKSLGQTAAPKVDPAKQPSTPTTLSQALRQGGAEPSFTGEFEELAALTRKLEAQQGN